MFQPRADRHTERRLCCAIRVLRLKAGVPGADRIRSVKAALSKVPLLVRKPAAKLFGAWGAFFTLSATSATAQTTAAPQTGPTISVTASPVLTKEELLLFLAVLVFGLIVVTLEYLLLSRAQSNADESLRTLTVTLIVVVSLALVASGWGKDQITPVLGLFGTIVGYLLGASRSPSTPSTTPAGKKGDGEKSGV